MPAKKNINFGSVKNVKTISELVSEQTDGHRMAIFCLILLRKLIRLFFDEFVS